MIKYTDKQTLASAMEETYAEMMNLIQDTPMEVLEHEFAPLAPNAKCCTFEQGNNLRDLLMHAYEWQLLQKDFVANIRNNTPKDFIPEPYRKNYKEMDRVNWERHQSVTLAEAIELIKKSHQEMMALEDTFTNEELMEKKVFKVTYTTTMAAYFQSVTLSPYQQIFKKLKSHIRKCKIA